MSYELWAIPDENAAIACYDSFCDVDDPSEIFLGLGVAEWTPASYHLFDYLAGRVAGSDHGLVAHTDSGDEIMLLIERSCWDTESVQRGWAQIIATSREKLIEQARIRTAPYVFDQSCEEWCNIDEADRLRRLIDDDRFDLSCVIADDPTEEAIEKIVDLQIMALLS